MESAVKIQLSGSGHNDMEQMRKTQIGQPQLQPRSSAWGRMLLTGTLIFGLAVGVSAAGKKGKAEPKEETRITQVSQSQIPARAASTVDVPKPKKNPLLVTASKWVKINGQDYKLVLQTRDDWDYVNTGVDLTPENDNDPIEFSKYDLSVLDSNVDNLVGRALTIGEYGWVLTGQNGVYRHLIVNGFVGQTEPCVISLKGLSTNFKSCGLESKPSFNGRTFVWSLFKDGKILGSMRASPSCEIIESLESLPTDSNDCPVSAKRASLK